MIRLAESVRWLGGNNEIKASEAYIYHSSSSKLFYVNLFFPNNKEPFIIVKDKWNFLMLFFHKKRALFSEEIGFHPAYLLLEITQNNH